MTDTPTTTKPIQRIELMSSEVLDGGAVWLRYRFHES